MTSNALLLEQLKDMMRLRCRLKAASRVAVDLFEKDPTLISRMRLLIAQQRSHQSRVRVRRLHKQYEASLPVRKRLQRWLRTKALLFRAVSTTCEKQRSHCV